MNKTPCPCGEPLCSGVNDGGYHQCGGPTEACKIPGCRECGTPLGETIESLRTDLSASRRESAALGAMAARLREALELAIGVIGEGVDRCGLYAIGWNERHADANGGESKQYTLAMKSIHKQIDAALALTPATVEAEYESLVELEHAIGEVRRHWGSAVGATDGQRAVIDALAKLESTRALLSDRAPGKDESK